MYTHIKEVSYQDKDTSYLLHPTTNICYILSGTTSQLYFSLHSSPAYMHYYQKIKKLGNEQK